MKMTKRQKWREKIILRCIDNGVTGVDIATTLDHAERFVFQDELIVPIDNDEQRQQVILAIQTVSPNFDELAKFKKAIK